MNIEIKITGDGNNIGVASSLKQFANALLDVEFLERLRKVGKLTLEDSIAIMEVSEFSD